MITVTNTPSVSELIHEALLVVHRRSHRWRYLNALLAGELPVSAFGEFVTQRYFIFQAFEESADLVRQDPVCAPFLFPELDRVDVIKGDLEFFHGPDWASTIAPYPVTRDHCARIRKLAAEWPAGYIAQHHVRYVGDLAGGQVFRDKMTEFQGLSGPGIEFYTFAEIPDAGAFRKTYIEMLDAAPWDAAEAQRIADEAAYAFDQTMQLFEELAVHTMDAAPEQPA